MTYCPNFSPGGPRGNSYFFRKLCINITDQGKQTKNTKNNFSYFSENWVRDLPEVPGNTSPILVHLPCIYYFLSIFTNCPRGTFWPILDKMDFRKFRKKWKILSIAVFKQNLQKIIFPIFPKTGSGTCPGSPGGPPNFGPFALNLLFFGRFYRPPPGTNFDQFCTKCIFANFEKKCKMLVIAVF